jgi:hypothetical protein
MSVLKYATYSSSFLTEELRQVWMGAAVFSAVQGFRQAGIWLPQFIAAENQPENAWRFSNE